MTLMFWVCVIETVEAQTIKTGSTSWKGSIYHVVRFELVLTWYPESIWKISMRTFERCWTSRQHWEPCTWIRGLETLNMAEIAKDQWGWRRGQRAVIREPATSLGLEEEGQKQQERSKKQNQNGRMPRSWVSIDFSREKRRSTVERWREGSFFWWLAGG